jgi:beta-ureidopropionase / N-carbamoyl-L-amino-acid hydrolase
VLRDAERRLFEMCDRVAAEEGVRIERRSLARFDSVQFDPGMADLVEQTAQRLGYRTHRMPSGAGHDAQMLARVCPASMIFVPSRDGLSHNLAEYTEPDQIAAGANVLLHVVLERAQLEPRQGATP